MNSNIVSEINRLEFENYIWLLFIALSLINIYGDDVQKEYLLTNNTRLKAKSNRAFTLTVISSLFIYIYFYNRNHEVYINASAENKGVYSIKVLGSVLYIIATLILIWFQFNETDFIGAPAI